MIAALVLAMAQVDWKADFESARAQAGDRLLAVHFVLNDRPLTRTMDEETFGNADVGAALRERFIPVRVDINARPELFDKLVGGRGGLATVVADREGDVVSVLSGFAGPKAFLLFLEKASKGYAPLRAAREAHLRTPADLGALHALGDAYRGLDSLRRAEECYRKVIDAPVAGESRRAVAASHERLARFRVMRGKNLEARRHLEEWRKLGAGDALLDRILLTEGLVLAIERKHAEAAAVFQEALRKFPASEEADHLHFGLGFVLHQAGQDKPAMETLESLLKKFPQSGWVVQAREQIEHIKNPQPDHQH